MTDPAHTQLDTELLDLIQNEFPLTARPYAAFAERLGVSEQQVLDRIASLRAARQIRQISAIFDTRKLGYRTTLVAAKARPEHADQAAAIINGHPGVSHNYLRDHEYNIWFTVAVPPDSALGLERTVDILGELSGVDEIRLLPTLRFFKIGVDLDIKGGRDPKAKKQRRDPDLPAPDPSELTQDDIRAIRALQRDLPAVPQPFAQLASQAGMSEQQLLAAGEQFLKTGQMRRFAAVLYHRDAGFTFNGMGVWKVPEERVDEVGRTMGAYRGVSHCYRRPTYPDWPYNLFSMTHGRTKAECEDVLSAISDETGLDDYIVLYSTKEYKKIRVSYFTREVYEWEAAHAPLVAGV